MHLTVATATVEHMHRRGAAYCLALTTLLAACGKGPDVASDRVVASPLPSASVDPLGTKEPKTARPRPRSPEPSTPRPGTVTRATAAPADPDDLADARVKLTKIATLDDDPVAIAVRRGDSAFYIAERHSGHVHRVRGSSIGAPILDIGDEISTGYEQGLLGLAFSPDGDEMYINFTSATSQTPPNVADTVIREYNFDGRPTSPREVLRIPQPATNHNGGNLMFGRDGYLYIGMGDGGGAPENRSQDLDVLLGKMLRIDPRPGTPDCGDGDYRIPSSNPFVGRSGCDEIWARGLRNPWRYSFDRTTDALWIGDVGGGAREEIDVASGDSDGGENYGWPAMEGTQGTPPAGHHGPIYEYSHDDGRCSVTGGYVYRGSRIPALRGAYVFVDHCVGRLRAFVNVGGRATGHRFLGPRAERLSSFGQDAKGELYAVTLTGDFYRIDPA